MSSNNFQKCTLKCILVFSFILNAQQVFCNQITKCCKSNEVISISETDFQPSCYKVVDMAQWNPILYFDQYNKVSSNEALNSTINYYNKSITDNFIVILPLPGKESLNAKLSFPKFHWRLLTNGSVIYLDANRKWSLIDVEFFCIDSIYLKDSGSYEYNPEDETSQIMLVKPKKQSPSMDLLFNINKDLIYTILGFIAAFFYALTFIVYLFLFSKSNSNGWSILGFTGSLFFLNVLQGLVRLVGLLPDLNLHLNSWCLGVSLHFFALASFVWMALMSFDVMKTMRSQAVTPGKNKQSGKFVLYCLTGWGIPLLFIAVFVTLDSIYADPITEVIVPEYGVQNAFIAPYAQGIYLYYIIAVILLINFVFTAISVYSFWALKKNIKILSSEGAFSSIKQNCFSLKLYLKLFVLTGSVWIFEVISWAHTGSLNPWYYTVTDILTYSQSVWIFLLFVCSKKTKGMLIKKSKNVGDSLHKLNYQISNVSQSQSRSNSQHAQITQDKV